MADWGIVAARFLQFGPALILFGTPLYFLYGIDRGGAVQMSRSSHGLKHAVAAAGILSLTGAIWWVLAETAMIFSDPGQFTPDAVWTVLTGTGFGRAAFLRIILIAVAIAVPFVIRSSRRLWLVQAVIGAAVVVSFAWTGHGVKDEGAAGYVHLIGDIVHLLAASIWVGALLALAAVLSESVRTRTGAQDVLRGLAAFSSVGVAVVGLLFLSGMINSWFLVGPSHLRQLVTSPYGLLLDAKLVLFAAMLAFAAANRYRFTPRLNAALAQAGSQEESLTVLRRSIVLETALAALVLAIVSLMGTLEPPA
ncbi:MAG TPA: copper homeostasis membrane protein CopD [Micropepsaceae bacterium]|nr:copper homeostasis membrane protein CopD [Micropepsaceae bacterium]